jgi:hypothetical protein
MGYQKHKGEKGQVAVLFALVFTFLFVIFAFVVDFAHLINAKINLQIAADTAAYAGAAWQARALNKMSMVNYHLRQDWKEFAMRVNVTHLRHNRNFPRGPGFYKGGPSVPNVDPLICQQAHGYSSLSGLQYSSDTNLCRNADPSTGGLPPIVVPPVIAAFDPFAVAIASQIRQIQVKANQECRAAAADNRILAEHLVNVFRQRARFKADQMRGLADWLNSVARENPNSTNHPLFLTALESAGRNLSRANQDDFKFEILQPQGNEYIRLEEAQARASVFFINFQEQGNGCVGRPGFLDFESVPVSFAKTESVVTYFAVKLTSKPRLLFMPAKWIEDGFPELTAYASAKPFGSRLGPDGTLDQLVPVPNRPGNVSRLINFSFIPNDNRGIFNTKIMAYLDALHPFNGAGRPDGNQQTGWPEPNKGENLKAALQAIRAPTIFDGLMYSVFPDPGANKLQDYLEPQFADALYPDYLEAADPVQNSILQMPQPRTPAYLPTALGSRNNGPGWIQINATDNGGGGGGPYGTYAEEQISSHSTTSVLGLPEMNDPLEFGYADRKIIHSGWAPDGKPGRIGYSVKFIGMDALRRTLRVRQNGAEGRIANPPTGDPNLDKIFH